MCSTSFYSRGFPSICQEYCPFCGGFWPVDTCALRAVWRSIGIFTTASEMLLEGNDFHYVRFKPAVPECAGMKNEIGSQTLIPNLMFPT